MYMKAAKFILSFPGSSDQVKNPPTMHETWVWCMGGEDPLEKGMGTHSSILAWRIPMDRGTWWAMQSIGLQKSDTTERLSSSSG